MCGAVRRHESILLTYVQRSLSYNHKLHAGVAQRNNMNTPCRWFACRVRRFKSVFCALTSIPVVFSLTAFRAEAQQPIGIQKTGVAVEDFQSRRAARPEDAKARGIPPVPGHLVLNRARNGAADLAAKRDVGTRASSSTYTYADLNSLGYSTLVTTLAGIQSSQITDLFQFNAGSDAFYMDANRVQYLIDALQTRASSFTTVDDQGITTLVEVIRAGFYLGFYHADLAALNSRTYKNTCLPAIRAAQANPNFKLGTTVQDDVVQEFGLLIDDADSDPGVINGFIPIMKDFNDHWVSYSSNASKTLAVYDVIAGIDYDLTWGVLQGGAYNVAAAGAFAGSIDGYLNEVARLAISFDYNSSASNWLIDSAVYIVGYDGRFDSSPAFALVTLTAAIGKYGSSPWIFPSAQAAEIIHTFYNDTDSNGRTRNWPQIQGEIRSYYTPVQRDFDGGLFHTDVGTQLDATKIKTLIWAHKETKAQFFRALRNDVPVDSSHHEDDSLTIIVYNNPDDYRMNRFAYELATNNGGIYIESLGTFFTYERTPQQSIYSLEELFRHEGVHYLQGRYEEPGYFGDSPLYDNDRLTWIDEGSAEFFAGSTRTDGVKIRLIKAQLIAGYAPSTWYSISDVVHATYSSGFTFYDYANAFVAYLYQNHWDNYLSMLDRIAANDGTGFSNIAAADAADPAMNSAYRNFLQYLADNANTFPAPSTASDYLNTPPSKPLAEIYSDVQGVSGLTGITITTTTCLDWDTYSLRGAYNAGLSQGSLLADWQAMDSKVNSWLKSLTAMPWSGYRTTTAYFVDYRIDSSNNVTWQVVIHGILNNGTRMPTAVLSAFSPSAGAAGVSVVLTGSFFTGASAVKFNGVASASFSVDSDTQITVSVPPGATAGPISVDTPAGTGFSSTDFKVIGIYSFFPIGAGIRWHVGLTGAGFTGATAVEFNGLPAGAFNVTSDTQIDSWVPVGATAGPIVVHSPAGTLTSSTNLLVIGISDFSPKRGGPGTSVTLTGQAFTGATGVQFNDASTGAFVVQSDSEIVATVPPGATTGIVTVMMPGNANFFSSDEFTVTAGVTPIQKKVRGQITSQ